MAKRCRLCGAWVASAADHMPFPEQLIKLYPVLGYLADAAMDYDRGSRPIVSVDDDDSIVWGDVESTTAVEFVEWLDFHVREAAGITQGRSYGPGSPHEVLRAKELAR
jgi:hypothetical protein